MAFLAGMAVGAALVVAVLAYAWHRNVIDEDDFSRE